MPVIIVKSQLSESQGVDQVQALYDGIAAEYDAIAQRVNYEPYLQAYLDVLCKYDLLSGNLVDLGCGTGISSLFFASRGYSVTGIDLSPKMIELAKQKPRSSDIDFTTGDLRDLPRIGPFDAAVSVGDPWKHLSTEEELRLSFSSVARILCMGAVFVFDLGTPAHYRKLKQSISNEAKVAQRGSPVARTDESARRFPMFRNSRFSVIQVKDALKCAGFISPAIYSLSEEGRLGEFTSDEIDQRLLMVTRIAEPLSS
ncbi:class I SAM-dependent DNA methyltransferase [Streptomyces sp. NPDC001139]